MKRGRKKSKSVKEPDVTRKWQPRQMTNHQQPILYIRTTLNVKANRSTIHNLSIENSFYISNDSNIIEFSSEFIKMKIESNSKLELSVSNNKRNEFNFRDQLIFFKYQIASFISILLAHTFERFPIGKQKFFPRPFSEHASSKGTKTP